MEVVLAALLLILGDASPQPSPVKPGPTVLFICLHGAAKSLMASAYFQTLAKERGLNVRVDSAGTEPDPQLSQGVVAHLQKTGYAIPIEKPPAATAADMKGADIIVSMGCDLSKLPSPRALHHKREDRHAILGGARPDDAKAGNLAHAPLWSKASGSRSARRQ